MALIDSITTCVTGLRASGNVMVALVYATLMLDNMLLTAIVPILPEYLEEHQALKLSEIPDVAITPSTASAYSLHTDSYSQTGNKVTIQSFEDATDSFDAKNKNCQNNSAEEYFLEENIYIGILFASKPIVQVVTNVAVGPVSDRIGFDIPMFAGYVIMCTSSVMFAFGRNYAELLVARAVQGIGSACASTAGIGMLADRFTDDEERGKVIGIALGGLAMGVLTGPVFGSVVYQLANKQCVFLILAGLAVLLSITQLIVRGLNIQRLPQDAEVIRLWKLLRDPYILIAACSIMLGNMCIGVLEAGQPLWMIRKMCSPKWALGVAFLPESISYLVVTNIAALCCQKLPRWSVCTVAFLIVTIGCLSLPFAKSLPELIGPGLLIGSAVGMVDTSMFPVMGYLVDSRHEPMYGSVYAIADAAFCVAFIVGPISAGAIISAIGFKWLMWIVAIVTFLFTPFILFLRKPTQKSEETKPILHRCSGNDDDVFLGEVNGRIVDSSLK